MGFIKFKLPDIPFLRRFLEPIFALKEVRHQVAFGVFMVLAVSIYINVTSKRHYQWYEKIFMVLFLIFLLLLSATLIVQI